MRLASSPVIVFWLLMAPANSYLYLSIHYGRLRFVWTQESFVKQGTKMKACETLFAWNPGGTVRVGPLIPANHADWTDPYVYTAGAAYTDVRKLSGTEATAKLLVDFVCMVVRDGVDPLQAHTEFMNIAEYRAAMPDDMP